MDLLQAEQGVDGSRSFRRAAPLPTTPSAGEDDPRAAYQRASGGRSVAVRHKSHAITACGQADHGSLIALIKP
jgi:SRSO17 transposase